MAKLEVMASARPIYLPAVPECQQSPRPTSPAPFTTGQFAPAKEPYLSSSMVSDNNIARRNERGVKASVRYPVRAISDGPRLDETGDGEGQALAPGETRRKDR
jgi:hypothetical protein